MISDDLRCINIMSRRKGYKRTDSIENIPHIFADYLKDAPIPGDIR